MNEYYIGDRVLVRKGAPVYGFDSVFTYVMSVVLDIQGDDLVLGIHNHTLTIKNEFCEKFTEDNMEKRVRLFEATLHSFLEYFGARIYGAKDGSIVVTLDEGESFFKMRPNHERVDKNNSKW